MNDAHLRDRKSCLDAGSRVEGLAFRPSKVTAEEVEFIGRKMFASNKRRS